MGDERMKLDLTTRCALCGERFPYTRPLYANMSGTYHQTQLPCPCTTRRPPEVPKPVLTLEQLNAKSAAELKAIFQDIVHSPRPGAIIDDEP
jgi:hypothetical protein